jgi:hypothetical protein
LRSAIAASGDRHVHDRVIEIGRMHVRRLEGLLR